MPERNGNGSKLQFLEV